MLTKITYAKVPKLQLVPENFCGHEILVSESYFLLK